MPLGAQIFLGVILVGFTVLDIFLLVSLLRPGDERNQIIAWKASSFTLLGIVGWLILDIIESWITKSPMTINPFIHLEIIVIVYFVSLIYYRRKYGG